MWRRPPKEKQYNIVKVKSRLIFTRLEDNRKAEYDLATRKFYNHRLDGKVTEVKSIANLFTGTDARYVCQCFEDEKYKNFVKYVISFEDRCWNMSTMLDRLSDYAHIEAYLASGINVKEKASYRSGKHSLLTKPMSFYHKDILKIVRKYDIVLNKEFEDRFIEDYDLYKRYLLYIDKNFSEEFIDYFKYMGNDNFRDLIKNYGYDFKRLLEYVEYVDQHEAMHKGNCLTYLRDYARMNSVLSRNGKFQKYPKYLATMHDIVTRNYNAFKQEYDQELFKIATDEYRHFEFKNKNYHIIVPSNPSDVKSEGVDLSHCVGSYVNSIMDRKTQIVFLRKSNNLNESLVTIEIKVNAIVQAKGLYNRSITKEEREFIGKWAKEKQLIVRV